MPLRVFLSHASADKPLGEGGDVNSGTTRLIPVLIGDCDLPNMLANKKYGDLRTNQ